MPPPPNLAARPLPRPWRSSALAAAVAAAALIAGVPLFLRSPPWCDLTLYDIAARNILAGGVHFRDVFDTNLPGFVWVLAAIRATLGWGVEAARAVDLVIVAGVVALLDRLAAQGGAPGWARAWVVAGVAVFYPFASEFNHCQRDVWMTLPALAAVLLRTRPGGGFGRAVLEGLLWGLAVWVKPHVVVPAAAVWLATAPRLAAAGGRRVVAADLLGNLLGGLAVGLVGVAALVATGTWEPFVEVFTFWNAGYFGTMVGELPRRIGLQLSYFPPWSYLQLVSLPAAVLMVLDARPWKVYPDGPGPVGRRLPAWLWDPAADDRARYGRMVLSVVYLGWTAQGLFLQREFHYVHVPETLMLLAVLATQRWAAGAFGVGWLAIAGLAVLAGVPADNPPAGRTETWPWPRPRLAVRHPVFDPGRMRLWAECWRTDLDRAAYRRRMNALRSETDFHSAIDWEQIGEAADWLAARGVKDGEVLAWHDSPHAVYLELGVRPGFRFQHVYQMMCVGDAQAEEIRRELCAAAPHVRFVVSDLRLPAVIGDDWSGDITTTGPDLLPPGMAGALREEFPYQEPAVFRSGGGRGRYVVHALRKPIPGCGG